MRRITIALMSTLSGLVLLFSYHTSTSSGTALASTGTSGSSGSTTDGSGSPEGGTPTADGGTDGLTRSGAVGGDPAPATGASGSYTGDAVMTRWGLVQVRITVENGKITSSEAIQYPQENHRDVEINSYAVPALNEAAVQAQSADLDAVSGATVTSEGYVQSLQSALDQAHK